MGKVEFGRGSLVNVFPLNFGPDGAGDGRFHRTSSECILDGGAWQIQVYDENIGANMRLWKRPF